MCSKLTIKTPERDYCHRFDVFSVNFENSSHLFLKFLLLLGTSKCLLGTSCRGSRKLDCCAYQFLRRGIPSTFTRNFKLRSL